LPKVWLIPHVDGNIVMSPHEHPDGMAVDMNASLYRQIVAANKQYVKFQRLLDKFYMEAVEHPDTVRRVK